MLAGFQGLGKTLAPRGSRRQAKTVRTVITAQQRPPTLAALGDDYGATQDDAAASAGTYLPDNPADAVPAPATAAASPSLSSQALPWLTDIAQTAGAVSSLLAPPKAATPVYAAPKSNTTMYLILGGVAVLGIGMFMMNKKSA